MTEPKTLDNIAERLGVGPEIRAGLQSAYDLGRADRDKEWRTALKGEY